MGFLDRLFRITQEFEEKTHQFPRETVDLFVKREAERILREAKAKHPVVTSCPHLDTLYKDHESDDWHCSVCGQIVHPDPEGLKYGYREFGRKPLPVWEIPDLGELP